MNADDWFQVMVILALFACVPYAIIYASLTRWWKNWIGWALLTKAVGLSIVLGYTAAFLVLGPDYPFRNAIRNTGMAIVVTGLWMALGAMVRALFQRRDKRAAR